MLNLNTLVKTISDTHKTLFILCGFPYAGKSYVANQLLNETDMAFVSIDVIFHARKFDWSTNKLPNDQEWQDIFDEAYRQVRVALEGGKNVLYDSTNQTVESRDELREVALSVGADAKVVYIQSSEEVVWKRWEENQKNPSRSVVSRELVQLTIDMFEEPTENEAVIVIKN